MQSGGAEFPAPPVPGVGRAVPGAGVSNAFTPGGYGNGHANGNGNAYGSANRNADGYANGHAAGTPFGGDQPGPAAPPLPTRRPPRDGRAPGNP